ncbi:MAG: hypothetical protein WA782_20060 [Sulfitobacter sp.]
MVNEVKSFLLFVVLFLVSFTSAGLAEDDVVTWKPDVNGWEILVDRTIGNGCFMYTKYEKGTYLRMQFNPTSGDAEFIIGDTKWRSLEKGKLYPMSVQFGNLGPWTGNGRGFFFGEGAPSLILSIPFKEDRASNFIDEFMKMTSVKVKYEDRQIAHLSLRGTYGAMEEVFSCQRAMFSTSDGGDPFSSNGAGSVDPFE